jgi:hypothetical protein
MFGFRLRFLSLAVAAACSGTPVGEGSRRDLTPPELDVRAPARGTIAAAGTTSVEVRGRAGDAATGIERLTVNGAPVTVAASGDFAVTVPLIPGITLIQTDPDPRRRPRGQRALRDPRRALRRPGAARDHGA